MAIQPPRRFVITDQGHADVLNVPIDTLYDNDLDLQSQIDSIKENPAENGVVADEDFQDHIGDTVAHITAAERAAWNAAEGNAKAYTDTAAAPKVHSHTASDLPSATTQARGVVQLNTSTTSTATNQAATPSAVKAAYDAANAANNASVPRATRSTNNLNSITENGFYDGSSMANAPSTDWHYVENIVHSANPGAWRFQRATNFNTGVTYWRQLRAGTWTAWQTWGGGVKKVTRYAVRFENGDPDRESQIYLTIPQVDPSKTSVNVTSYRLYGFARYSDTSSIYSPTPGRTHPGVYLFDATRVRLWLGESLNVNGSGSLSVEVYFEIIEYN
ncbi:pyocin knob domain-containing protein [Paenibacillus sanguinis]|uniref:pyocin knob domain-containing protein n=1 Tax=Paenibacillus sanguinis TaxID=225906 RepID=UPI00036E2F9C|nr:pyocin knob domain-containing protein [Paenibacillus sanguinis]